MGHNARATRPAGPPVALPTYLSGTRSLAPVLCVYMKTIKLLCAALLGTGAVTGLAPVAFAQAPASSSFHPLSVTFVSLDTGWALGTVPCKSSGECLNLVKTTNQGRSWSTQPLPAKLLTLADRPVTNGVPKGTPGFEKLPAFLFELDAGFGLGTRFANAKDGWIYGTLPHSVSSVAPVLWATHNGGKTWRQLSVGPNPANSEILDLEAAGGTAYLMRTQTGPSYDVRVESTPVGSNNWHTDSTPRLGLPAGGGQLQGAIVLQGSVGWLVEGNDRGVTGSAQLVGNGKWAPWVPPCAAVGDTLVVPAASNASNLVAACQMGGYASPLPQSAPAGATLGSWWLYSSADGGQSFVAGPRLGGNTYPFTGLVASPVPGTMFLGYGGFGARRTGLIGSFDGGHSWTFFSKGSFFYLGFTSPTQGVGLLRTAPNNMANTRMVMTFDGGRHWAKVSF